MSRVKNRSKIIEYFEKNIVEINYQGLKLRHYSSIATGTQSPDCASNSNRPDAAIFFPNSAFIAAAEYGNSELWNFMSQHDVDQVR